MATYDTVANPVLTTVEVSAVASDMRTALGLGTAAVEDADAFAINLTTTDLAAGTALSLNRRYFDSFTANRTLTFSGTPADGDSISLTFDCNTGVTLTIPTSYRTGYESTTTSLAFTTGNHSITWTRLDSRWYVTSI